MERTIPLSIVEEAVGAEGAIVLAAVNLSELSAHAAKHSRWFSAWQQQGAAGEMRYMLRSPELLSRPDKLRRGAKSVVSLGIPYYKRPAEEPLPVGFGRISCYARNKDYHQVVRELLSDICKKLRLADPRVFTDAVPLLERAVAVSSNLAFIGKNTMVIRPGVGSYFFLGEILLEEELAGELRPNGRRIASQASGLPWAACKSCSRCLDACPTSAFQRAGFLDSNKCISYLTIEKRTAFSPSEGRAIGEWLFGCDVCQQVCPFNLGSKMKEVSRRFQVGGGVPLLMDLKEAINIGSSQALFKDFISDTALSRVSRRMWLRNTAWVTANLGVTTLFDALCRLSREDPDGWLRSQVSESLESFCGLS